MTVDKTINNDNFNLIVRIFNTDIKGKQKLTRGLCKIRGIDKMFSNAVITISGIDKDKLIGNLTEEEIKKIENIIKSPKESNIPTFLFNRRIDPEKAIDIHSVSNELKLHNDFDIRRLRRIRSYKGIRHGLNLKVRGQKLKSWRRGGAAIARKKTRLK